MSKRFITVAVFFFLATIGFIGCTDSDSTNSSNKSDTGLSSINEQSDSVLSTTNEQIQSVRITLPGMPFEDTEAVKIDQDLITSLAQEYCSLAGEQASSPAFFLGYLPLVAADALGGDNLSADIVARHLGSLAVSGFFGGIWLRDALRDRDAAQALGESGLSVLPLEGLDSEGTTQISPVFNVLSTLAGSATSTALDGTDTAVINAGRASIIPFLIVYGYNWGYFYYILENPPEGATVPDEYDTVCSRFLDCGPPNAAMNTLMDYEYSLDFLYADESVVDVNAKWRVMKANMNLWGLGAVNTGDFVWQLIMNDQMSPDVYELLLDLSARFMVVAELCVLPAMAGYAEDDPTASRVAILEQAGMVMWAGTYFMGLLSQVSNVPTGTFPELIAVN